MNEYDSILTSSHRRPQGIIHRKSVKHYAKSLQDFDDWSSNAEEENCENPYSDYSNNTRKTLIPIYANINNNNGETAFGAQISKSQNYENEEINQNKNSNLETKDNEKKSNDFSGIVSQTLNSIKSFFSNESNKPDNTINPSVLKHVLHTVDSRNDEEDSKVDIRKLKRAYFDLHIYGTILQIIIIVVLLFLIFIGYHAIYHRCELADNEINKWILEIRKCSITPLMTTFIKTSLLISNCLTFCLIAYDKYQAINHGYRVFESLIILCIFAGGIPTAWILLFALSHKTKRFYFMLNATIATLFSSFWFYLYHILDL
jgi:uncharacterized membrane protein YsdA (DUF1294 family)